MKRGFQKVFAAIVFSLFASNVFAQNKAPRGAQTLIPPRHWIYDSLQILEQESGIVQFSDQAPLAIQQIRAMLLEIDYDALSANAKAHYDNIIEYFNETQFSAQASIMQARIEPAVNLEGYVKTNDDVFWIYDRFEKQKLVELPITISVDDFVALHSDIFLGINKSAMDNGKIFSNIPYNKENLDSSPFQNAYFSLGGMFSENVGVNFHISNMPQSFGRAQSGSIILSEYLQDAADVGLSFFSPMVQFSSAITELNLDRYMYSHKLDVRLGKKKNFQISAMEASLPFGGIDLRFFNPMMVFHGYFSWLDYNEKDSDVGSYFGIKINYAPVKNLRLYAAATMTQYQLPFELEEDYFYGHDSMLVPNAMGWQGGVESYIPLGKGHLRLNLEGYYAQPYLYINASPNWSFVKSASDGNGGSLYEWVGTKYGPDTATFSFSAEYQVPQKWSAGFKYIFIARGELSDPGIFKKVGGRGYNLMNIGSSYPGGIDQYLKDNWVYPRSGGIERYKKGREFAAPYGTPEFANVVSLYGNYFVNGWLEFFAQPSLAVVFNDKHIAGKTDFSFECVLTARIKFSKIKQ